MMPDDQRERKKDTEQGQVPPADVAAGNLPTPRPVGLRQVDDSGVVSRPLDDFGQLPTIHPGKNSNTCPAGFQIHFDPLDAIHLLQCPLDIAYATHTIHPADRQFADYHGF
jgi:hypothetical protein